MAPLLAFKVQARKKESLSASRSYLIHKIAKFEAIPNLVTFCGNVSECSIFAIGYFSQIMTRVKTLQIALAFEIMPHNYRQKPSRSQLS